MANESLSNLLSIINNQAEKQKQSITGNLSSLTEASQYANNEESIKNIVDNWQTMENDSSMFKDTDMQHDLIGNILKSKEAQINQYTKTINDSELMMNDVKFLDKESEFVDLHDNVMGITDENGNKKYESVMEWVSQEYAKIDAWHLTIANGRKVGLARGKGIDDDNIFSKLNQYKNSLNVAMEALIGDETITAEEAQAIIRGDIDAFRVTRNNKKNDIVYGIKNYDSLIETIDKQVNNISKGVGEDMSEFMKILQSSTSGKELDNNQIQDIVNTANDEGFFNMDSSELTTTRDFYIKERDALIDSYKYWTGSDFIGEFKTAGQISAQELEDYASGDDFSGTDLVYDESLAEQSFRPGISIEESKKQDIEKENVIKREEIRKELAPKIEGTSQLKANQSINRAKKFNVHPSLLEEVKKREPRGFGYPDTFGGDEFIFHNKIMDKSNRLKEKDKILDGSDKASPAMNEFLKGNLNMNQAMTKGKYSNSNRTEVVGSPSRKKLKAFQNKFDNSGLTIEEFIAQNKEEYYEMTKILKYGDYWWKNPKKIGNSKHYINLYD